MYKREARTGMSMFHMQEQNLNVPTGFDTIRFSQYAWEDKR